MYLEWRQHLSIFVITQPEFWIRFSQILQKKSSSKRWNIMWSFWRVLHITFNSFEKTPNSRASAKQTSDQHVQNDFGDFEITESWKNNNFWRSNVVAYYKLPINRNFQIMYKSMFWYGLIIWCWPPISMSGILQNLYPRNFAYVFKPPLVNLGSSGRHHEELRWVIVRLSCTVQHGSKEADQASRTRFKWEWR